MSGNASIDSVVAWLTKRHDQIMEEERVAKECLAAQDTEGYGAHLRAKAESLASLAKDAVPVLAHLSAEEQTAVKQGLLRFSQTAAYGLKLGSLFFLSALLYRDEHPVGEPDNLQVFIDELAKRGQSVAS